MRERGVGTPFADEARRDVEVVVVEEHGRVGLALELRHDRVGDAWRMIWQQTDLPKSYRCEHERYDPDGRIRICVGLR